MAKYLRPYRDAVRAFGTGFEALLWNNERMQRRRFEVLVEQIDLSGRTVADMGAGRADLLAFLVERGVPARAYLGVEGVEELREFCVTRARERAREGLWAAAAFPLADFVEEELIFQRLVREHRADTFLFSGSLNTLGEAIARRVLHRAWTALERVPGGAVAFNFLSDLRRARGEAGGPAVRFDTLSMIRFAFERTPIVAVRHDYLGDHDCTIVMRRDEVGGRPAG